MACAKGSDGKFALGTPCRRGQDALAAATRAAASGDISQAAKETRNMFGAVADKVTMTFKNGKLTAFSKNRRADD